MNLRMLLSLVRTLNLHNFMFIVFIPMYEPLEVIPHTQVALFHSKSILLRLLEFLYRI